MSSKSTKVAVAALLVAAVAVPAALNAHDRNGMNQSMRGMLFGGGQGFDFAGLDADGDGKITKEEMQQHRQSMIGGVDADGDNLISAEELSAHMAARMAERANLMAKARVEASDVDGDGKLSVEELIAPPMMGRMFDRLDANGDGAVSEDEIAAMHNLREGRGMFRDGRGMHRDGHGMGHNGWFGGGQGNGGANGVDE